MSENPAKDFAPIADDYAFFESHATEAANDSQAYVERRAGATHQDDGSHPAFVT